ncbi:MAG: RNA methyltransferase [Tannerella sp.]|jgi:TrmH family RNA methyltransferase|nr:RNA methyltransferase [Tannerella sp.]
MLSKAKIKEIRALEMKKRRDESGLFIAEGNKTVADMIQVFECEWLLARSSWMATQGDIPARELVLAEDDEIRKVSLMKTPQDVFAVFRKPVYSLSDASPASGLVLALDGVQDPGNLGTIVRIADWFGIEHIVCSPDTADAFGPKTVQSAMGALAHVQVHYTDLTAYISDYQSFRIYGAFLDGDNIYSKTLSSNGIIVLGNEGNGIRPETASFINERLFIPSFPPDRPTTDSLNVAVAAAVVVSHFRNSAITL